MSGRNDWTEAQVDVAVREYFEIKALQDSGIRPNKAEWHRRIGEEIGRSPKAVESKFCNISAVLFEGGLEYSKGYPPSYDNYQGILVRKVERYVFKHEDESPIDISPAVLTLPSLELVPAPESAAKRKPYKEDMQRFVRRVDAAARDAENRNLGLRGEECVFNFERQRLANLDRPDLAEQVRWISREEGDGAGYDIHSFAANGADRLLEVKTTKGSERTPFFLSENERLRSVKDPETFRIVRLYDFSVAPKAFRLKPPLDAVVSLEPAAYKVFLL